MATNPQISANQKNAQHSTGPRTEEGKAASSQNSLKFGFCGSFRVLSLENQEEFDAFLESLQDEHQPAATTESLLVQKMAEHYWLSRRAQHLQSMSLGHDIPYEQQCREFALYLRYQTTHDRAFHKSLDQLLKLQKERKKSEIGFVPQKAHKAVETLPQNSDAAAAQLEIKPLVPSPTHVALPSGDSKPVLSNGLPPITEDRSLQSTPKAA